MSHDLSALLEEAEEKKALYQNLKAKAEQALQEYVEAEQAFIRAFNEGRRRNRISPDETRNP